MTHPTCAWCGRAKGFYGPLGYCSYKCAVDAKDAAERAERRTSSASRKKHNGLEGR